MHVEVGEIAAKKSVNCRGLRVLMVQLPTALDHNWFSITGRRETRFVAFLKAAAAPGAA
jgi:hypothetical protein